MQQRAGRLPTLTQARNSACRPNQHRPWLSHLAVLHHKPRLKAPQQLQLRTTLQARVTSNRVAAGWCMCQAAISRRGSNRSNTVQAQQGESSPTQAHHTATVTCVALS